MKMKNCDLTLTTPAVLKLNHFWLHADSWVIGEKEEGLRRGGGGWGAVVTPT